MGVRERSPAGIALADRKQVLLEDFRRALPDFRPEDNVGSPYCVKRYRVDGHLGGPEGLAAAREELARRGLKLILDFVPNHVAPDHPWVEQHPDFFVSETEEQLAAQPQNYTLLDTAGGSRILAYGRDPYFAGWTDTLQLNYGNPEMQDALQAELRRIALQCDGVHCDMAMLVWSSASPSISTVAALMCLSLSRTFVICIWLLHRYPIR